MTWEEHYATTAGFQCWPDSELVRAMGARRFSHALDIGCGSGANLPLLLSRAGQVTGIDTDASAVQDARARFDGMDALTVEVGDAEELRFPPGMFDAVVDCEFSQHLHEAHHPALYRECRRVMSPGGWMFIKHLCTLSGKKELLSAAHGHDYINCAQLPDAPLVCLPSPAKLAVMVAGAGFKVLRYGYVSRRQDFRPERGEDSMTWTVLEAEAI